MKALVFCKAGLGTSMLLKLKVDQVISDNNYPIETIHGSLDEVDDFDGDLIITKDDLASSITNKNVDVIGIANIIDKEEIKNKIAEYFNHIK